jgi:Signal transduction histidine kinase
MPDIAMHLLDIIFNSIHAKAHLIKIYIKDSQKEDRIVCRIEDDGCGMDEQTQIEVQNPFFTTRTTRDVGLGIPLFKQGALQTGGQFHLASKLGEGTVIEAIYVKSNIDCPSLGDLAETLVTLIQADEKIAYEVDYRWDKGSFELKTEAIKEILDGVPINEPNIILWLKEYIKEGIQR